MITRTSTPRRATLAAAFAALFVGSLLTGCGETTGGIPCSSGWVTYGNTPYCYCAATDNLVDCNEVGKLATMVANEGVAWEGNANGPYVLDADHQAIWFGAEAPHVMHVDRAMIGSAYAGTDGSVYEAGRLVATIRSVRARNGELVAALVTPEGTWADVTLVDDVVRVVSTDIRASGSDGVAALASPQLAMGDPEARLDEDVLRKGRRPVLEPTARGDA
ncbi:MAG: hypothetical protein R3F05_17730 [Planctomycetota bacterium]